MAEEARAAGRPSKYTDEIATEIGDRLAKGEPLAAICRDDHMPSDRTVRNWMEQDAAFSSAIARAREVGFDALAAQCLEIAEDGSHDYKHKKRANGEEYEEFDSEHVQRSKLRIETRLKLLAKWDPKRYGDKVALEHTGKDGGPIETRDLSKLSDDKLATLEAILAEATDPQA
jgi:hypothetical protein